jgi:hypothetical protein
MLSPFLDHSWALDFDEAQLPISEFSIIEHLVSKHATNLQIAFALGLWDYDDDPKVRIQASNVIDTYFVRYQRRLALVRGIEYHEVSLNEVRAYIRSHHLGFLEFSEYLGTI